jgi:hypothetical protein
LDAPDRLLDMGRKILRPEAHAGDADTRKRGSEIARQPARIELDRMFLEPREIEGAAESVDEDD